jgi:hypothetical protein
MLCLKQLRTFCLKISSLLSSDFVKFRLLFDEK